MALVDYQTIFCDGQVIEETTLSNRSIDLQSLADYGQGRQWFVHCLVQGAHSNPLRVQVLGSDSNNFSNVEVIGDSGVIAAADLTFGSDFNVAINPIGAKYRYITLRFIPTINGSESETISDGTTGSGTIPGVTKVGAAVNAVAGAIRAQLEFLAVSDVTYPHANDNLNYSASQE